MKILCVCYGNICRSPMAEGILRRMLSEQNLDWQVDSAGISAEHTGEDMHRNTRKILERHSAAFHHQARQVRPEDAEFDLILAATKYQAHQLRQRFPKANIQPMLKDMDVPDPWYGTFADYEAVYALLEPAIEGLLADLVNRAKSTP